MNVEIGAEAALFPEKEYMNGIAVAVLSKVRGIVCKKRSVSSSMKEDNNAERKEKL